MTKHTPHRKTRKAERGFTLYELLITVLVIGVVLALGVPNFAEFTQNSRMTASANDLHAAFQLARTEAARAKSSITICASANSLAATPTCSGTWTDGYIVFVDDDDNAARASTEAILRVHGPAERNVSFAVADDATFFSFASTGLGRGDVGGNPALTQIVMCDDRGNITAAGGNSAARLFVSTPLGRATIVRDQTQIGQALTDMSKSCP
ncbi:MAG: GspH/FimT family pseudopilin [Woeseiaceae bacterium]|nr:GspH/FimT family pseudopilin [Woeseiaceae bacterium]